MHTSLFQWWHNHQRKSYLWWLQHQRYELITSNNMIVTRFLDFFLMWEIETPLICFFLLRKTIKNLPWFVFLFGKNNENRVIWTNVFLWKNKEKQWLKNQFVFLLGKQTKTHLSYMSKIKSQRIPIFICSKENRVLEWKKWNMLTKVWVYNLFTLRSKSIYLGFSFQITYN